MNSDPRWLHLHSNGKDNFIPISRINNVCTDFDNEAGSLVTLFNGAPISVDESPVDIMEMMGSQIVDLIEQP